MMTNLVKLDHDIDDGDGGSPWGGSARASMAVMAETTPAPILTPQPATVSSPAAPQSATYVAGLDSPLPPAIRQVIPPSASHTRAVRKKLAQTVPVSRAYAAAVVGRTDFAALVRANFDQINLEGTIKSLRALISAENDFSVIQKAHEKLAILETPSATAARDAVCNAIRRKMQPLCDATKSLIEVALAELDTLASQAKEDEATLFQSWGMDAQETPISRSIAAVRRELIETQKGVRMPEVMPHTTWHPNPECFNHAIDAFAVES